MDKTLSVQQHARSAVQPAPAEVREVISCGICAAAYAPAPSHGHLWQAPPLVVESAFMSMCRFCFRCRRPACPICWDEVNSVCGSCVREAGLPFRAESPVMAGVLFPPLRKAQTVREQTGPQPLVCVQAGRFHASIPPSAPVAPIPPVSTDPVKVVLVERATKQTREEKAKLSVEVISPSSSPKKRVPRAAKGGVKVTAQEEAPVAGWVRVGRSIERVLTGILVMVLLVIAVLVIAALVSVDANMFIARVLNIDIRAEIAYLLQILQQLH